MSEFIKVARVEEITPVRPKRVNIDSFDIVIFRKDNEIFAIENLCPHQLISAFHQGKLDGYTLTCPMYGWSFDIRDGKAIAGSGRIKTFEVCINENDVFIKQSDPKGSFLKN